jgi:hypothetical protein
VSEFPAAVDRFTADVSVTSVTSVPSGPSGFLDHVQPNPPQVPARHVRPRARRVEINTADLLRCGDLLPVEGDSSLDRVSSVSRKVGSRSSDCTSGHSPGKLREQRQGAHGCRPSSVLF